MKRFFLCGALLCVGALEGLRAQQGGAVIHRALPARGEVRIPIAADSGRGLRIQIARDSTSAKIVAKLFEPGRVPTRSPEPMVVGRSIDDGAVDLDAADVVAGTYELVLTGDAIRSSGISVKTMLAPVRLHASLEGANIRLNADNLTDTTVAVRFRVGLLGAGTTRHLSRTDGAPIRLAFPLPAWADNLVLDTSLPESARPHLGDLQVAIANRSGIAYGAAPGKGSFQRALIDLPQRTSDDSIIVTVRPTLATPGSTTPWSLDLHLRYEGQPVEIDPGGSPPRSAARGASAVETFPMRTAVPRPIPSGFDPVVQVVAMDAVNDWWRILQLAPRRGNH